METNIAEVQPWWQQGTLHDKTLADWLQAENQNRMASALDILIALQQDLGARIEYQQGDELMRYVYEMVGCMDAFATGVPDPEFISVANAALTSAQALGYIDPQNDQELELNQSPEPAQVDGSELC